MADNQDKGQANIDIQHDPSKQDPNLPVEAVMEKAGKTDPVERQYADSPPDLGVVTSTHDRDSVQPPTPGQPAYRFAPEMPLKDSNKDGQNG